MSSPDIFPISLNVVKVALLKCNKKVVLVDAGLRPEDAETILRYARNNLKMPLETYGEVCVITHNHRDHVGGLKTLAEKCRFKVAAHVSEADAIEATTGVKIDLRLKDGEILPYCGGMQIVHIPGHTKGNICIYVKERLLLIAGDTLNTDEKGDLNPPADRYNVDSEMAKKELRRLRKLDLDSIIVSHGKDIEKDGKKKLEELLHRLKL